MLSTHLLQNLGQVWGYRYCSSFASVLTLGKKSQLSDAKSSHSAESVQDAYDLSNCNVSKEDEQVKYVDNERNSHSSGERFSISAPHGTHEVSYEDTDAGNARKFKISKTDEWRSKADWRDKGGFDAPKHWKQRRVWKHSERRWDAPDKWDYRSTSTGKSGSAWDSDERQWHSLSKSSKKLSGYSHRPGLKIHSSPSYWNQNLDDLQNKKHHEDQSSLSSRSTWDQPRDKPRGKRLRKKEKLGFIESELAPTTPNAEQVLYGLHPVSLALASGQRHVRRVYHRADDTRPSGSRLSRLLAECAARGVGTVPLPAAQLDRIAGGTGVHQGVCARVTALLPQSVDELLTQAGCPPLVADPPPTAEAKDQRTAASSFWSVEADVMGSEGESETPTTSDTDDRLPVAAGSEADRSQETRLSGGESPRPEERAEAGSAEDAAPDSECPARRRRVWLMLDRVQDPMNFGSIIRSSYFLGVDAIIIPDRNSCPLSPTVSKASAGTLEVFPVYSAPADGCRQLLKLLASRQWQLLAAGTTADGSNQSDVVICPDTDTLLIVGNEGRGVDPSLASLCRPWTVPPQRRLADGVESLNVGVATGILLSQLMLAR